MSTPFGQGQQTWPGDPTMPSAAPAGYVTPQLPDPSRTEPLMTSAQVEARRNQFYELQFQKFLVTVTGFFVPGVNTFTQLQDWANSVGLGDILEILTGVPDADNNDLGTWVNTLLGINRPVPEIQAASVVDTNPNLILAPLFPSTGTVVAEQNWSWDNSAGHDSIGCAKVIAAGYVSELLSNQIRVVVGQKMDLSVWVRWSGLSYTGTNPIVMGVTRYLNYTEVGSTDLAFFGTPAGTQDWTQLASTYEVPSGCDEIRLRFRIGSNLDAGTIFWDDAVVIKNQPGSGYVGSFLDQIVNGLENVNAPGWDLTDLLISMLNQFRTTTDLGARVVILESLQSTGNKINDEFLRVGTTLGGNWNQTYIGAGAGTWETDGDYAFWRDSGFGTRDVRCRYIGSPSVTITDTQKIIAVLGSKGEQLFVFVSYRSHIDLYGRMDTGETNWIRARFSANGTVTITRSLAGVVTDLASVAGYDGITNPSGPQPPGAGSTIELLCGTGAGTRFFEARINGVAILTTSDSTSNVGASYRGYGHGARAEGDLIILGQVTPAKLNAWAAIDN